MTNTERRPVNNDGRGMTPEQMEYMLSAMGGGGKRTTITVHQSDSLSVTWDKWGRKHHVVLHRRGKTYKASHEIRRIAVANAWAKSAKRRRRLSSFWN